MHYYQFNIHEYHSHTRHLTLEEDAVFRRLLDYQYLHETALPNDVILLAKKCVMVGYENQIEYILNEFFKLTENGWVNKRAFQEIEKYQTHQQKSSLGGKISAARKSKGPSRGVENKFNTPSTNKEQRTINKEQLTINKEQCFLDAPDGEKKIEPLEEKKINTLGPIADDWRPSEKTLAMIPINWPDKLKDIEDEIFKFKTYYQAENKLKADWDKQFQLWLSNSKKFDARGPTTKSTGHRLGRVADEDEFAKLKARQDKGENLWQ